ncbi:hypothetical protein BCR33DRAFT_132877 [Rhizoclosmatium globosum]|uniref:Uncharacterized protein n=1 Tax=Rhizoclosmatium globosum TaxID=329046 RepID=A0A1Y2ALK4_9FUNG|nr:hypothetical protein BCR33DRAFT_132877 [Rhizoclosmatium globosum]|eukprot:ORY23448.1 hypothetical protein BCR33DRAFT_132877 [Rhizoclosmatium globosum]
MSKNDHKFIEQRSIGDSVSFKGIDTLMEKLTTLPVGYKHLRPLRSLILCNPSLKHTQNGLGYGLPCLQTLILT